RPARAAVADRADFGHAMVVHNARAAPEFFKMRASSLNTAAGFPGHDDSLHLGGGEVNLLFGCDFSQMHGVSGGAAENGGPGVDNGAQPAGGAHRPPRD